MNKELPMELDDSRFELENRVKNLLWPGHETGCIAVFKVRGNRPL